MSVSATNGGGKLACADLLEGSPSAGQWELRGGQGYGFGDIAAVFAREGLAFSPGRVKATFEAQQARKEE